MFLGDEAAWENCTQELHNKVPNIVSIKRSRNEADLDYKDDRLQKKKRSSDKKQGTGDRKQNPGKPNKTGRK